MRTCIYFILLAALLLGACPRVQEPWVKDQRLIRERSRSAEQTQILQDRLRRVQTDR